MNNSTGIRKKLYNYFLNKEFNALDHKHQSINLDKAQSIVMMFIDDDLNKQKAILNFAKELNQQGKSVKMLAYIPAKETPEHLPYEAFSKKDIDWIFRPKSNNVNEFQNTPFDILFNFTSTTNKPLEYISALSRAKFRIGTLSENTLCYDLMVDCKSNSNITKIIEQMKFYLGKMNRKESLTFA